MIEVMDYLGDKYQLDLMLVANRSDWFYFKKLKKMIKKRKNVRLVSPVPFDRIIPQLNGYDIGFFLLPPTNTSLKYALPNKFFEFIQARVAVVVGPSPEMARIVKKYNLGLVTQDFIPKNVAAEIRSLSSEAIFNYKKQTDLAAFRFSFENESRKLLEIINKQSEVSV